MTMVATGVYDQPATRRPVPVPGLGLPSTRGNCYGSTVDMFPDEGDAAGVASAKAVCVGCPIAGWCALEGRFHEHGIFAGESPEERRRRHKFTPAEYRLLNLLDEVGDVAIRTIAGEWEIGATEPAGRNIIWRLRKKSAGAA